MNWCNCSAVFQRPLKSTELSINYPNVVNVSYFFVEVHDIFRNCLVERFDADTEQTCDRFDLRFCEKVSLRKISSSRSFVRGGDCGEGFDVLRGFETAESKSGIDTADGVSNQMGFLGVEFF